MGIKVSLATALSALLCAASFIVASPAEAADPRFLTSGQSLSAGQSLTSRNNRCRVQMQNDGNLVVTLDGRPTWSTRTHGNPGASATMQSDGNFVVYSQDGRPKWSTRSNGLMGANVVIQDNCSFALFANNRVRWTSRSLTIKAPPEQRRFLLAGEKLSSGEALISRNGKCKAIMQPDGNMVLSDSGQAIWSSRTQRNPGAFAAMQSDGNFVVYARSGKPVFQSGTSRLPGANIVVADGCRLVVYANDRVRWVAPPTAISTVYANCDDARQAGKAPIRRGQAGYGRHLDRDGDGIACE